MSFPSTKEERTEKKNIGQNNQTAINDLDEFSSQKTRSKTAIDNTIFNLILLEKIYLDLIMKIITQRKIIGKGGQSVIKKYYSTIYKRTVVEKMVNINSNSKSKAIDDGLDILKEGIILKELDHPNIIKIYEFKKYPPIITMEYCEKGSLRKFLDERVNLDLIYKIYLIYSICNGLKYVHSKGIIHGDLKCANILLSDEKKFYIGKVSYPIPKIADFGLSQFEANNLEAGTPGFIAPEIYKGSGLNFKTDIFALGMVMFEILSGLKPLDFNLQQTKRFFEEKKIPCIKEILRVAWKLKLEQFLPGIKNEIYNLFYSIMINCIDDNPEERPSIDKIFSTVEKLYKLLLIISNHLCLNADE